ncbi:hypothetical protein [Cytobacillus sp. IB215316]|uniref:hypothetical protein n=1 Tax=Cytobacillus sp. IB215316 TaxID=3097354 RepID=UPI002A0C4EF3|nr:hypothetical protein [Cytobacillus sp. IB215316]MDX8362706.1 hypothetical protein [Cytobacillus sp. IB215316]
MNQTRYESFKALINNNMKNYRQKLLISLLVISVIINYVQYNKNQDQDDLLRDFYMEYISDIFSINRSFSYLENLNIEELKDAERSYSQMLQYISKLAHSHEINAAFETKLLIDNAYGLVKKLYSKTQSGTPFTEEDLLEIKEINKYFELFSRGTDYDIRNKSFKELKKELYNRNHRLIDVRYGKPPAKN